MSTTLEFCVDWGATDWTATPDFTDDIDDISAYVKAYSVDRGMKVEQGNTPAGTMNLTLDNSTARFSPVNTDSALTGLMRPWLPVRFRATVGATTYVVYTGFISRITCNPHGSKQYAMLYCTDGMDLLARNMVVQDEGQRSSVTDGDAVGALLDAAGWPVTKRQLDTSGGKIARYPLT